MFPIVRKLHGSPSSLHEQVVTPAMKLMFQITISSSAYDFHLPRPRWTDALVHKSMIQLHQLVDMSTRKTLTTRTNVKEGKGGYIGEALLALKPSFHRIKDDGQSIELVPSGFLVGLYHALGRATTQESSAREGLVN